jgi:2-dehydro-3-deoxyphosphogluconate aldolase/(4S)-4-hydroxy-2-oxoglutarate aldolase
MKFKETLAAVKVVPVCVFNNVDSALKTAELLIKKKVNIIEITLRTESAFSCIEAVVKEFKEMTAGAGSVFTAEQLKEAEAAGVEFAVSPCLDDDVMDEADRLSIPFVPGVATPGELFRAIKRAKVIKLFPAESLGGADYIKSAFAPFKLFDYCLMPTGGIDNNNFRKYLDIDKVIACGMSYPVSDKLINEGRFDRIEERINEIYQGII